MFELIYGLGNIVCVLALAGVPLALIKPALLKQHSRTDAVRMMGGLFLGGFLMVAVGQFYAT
jgi:hypothetical protein